ncbi:DegV family protein [uncultured Friedmanniella sp.]|uniref:DegV family protein n=1 Tax=uncultured Friedmanniella sp. TaxID=335381 RepID=UPI0035CC9573
MTGVAVVTDSTSSLAPGLTALTDVRVIPLQVVIDGVSRSEGEVGPAEVAAALRCGRRVSTSRPSAEVIRATYAGLVEEGFTDIVSVHLSGAISGTVAAAELAAAALVASEPGLVIRVLDTRVIAMASGFAALAGAAAARSGAEVDEVAAVVARRAAASSTWFYVEDLEHLRRGGRISAATAALGSALAVKPLLTVREGSIQTLERVRTTARAVARLEELALGAVPPAGGEPPEIAVHHLDDAAGAHQLAGRLAAAVPGVAPPVVSEVSAALGVHVGPGTLGVVVSPVV